MSGGEGRGEDSPVPPARLPEYVRGVRAALDRHRIRGVIFGHAGDAQVHANALIDVRETDWRERTRAFLGGTLAAEHGDGRLRTPLMFRVWDARAALDMVVRDQAWAAFRLGLLPEG